MCAKGASASSASFSKHQQAVTRLLVGEAAAAQPRDSRAPLLQATQLAPEVGRRSELARQAHAHARLPLLRSPSLPALHMPAKFGRIIE